MQTCKETMESIRFLLADGLMTLQNEEYYQGTTSEFKLMYILSFFFTGTNKNEFESFYYECVRKGIVDTTLQGRLAEMERAESTNKDYTNIYESSEIPADIINLLLLTFLDNTMQNSVDAVYPNPSGPPPSCETELWCPVYPERRGEWPPPSKGIFYEYLTSTLNLPPNNFDNKTTWERLPNYLYVYLNIIINVGNDEAKWKTLVRDLLSGGKKTRRKKRKKRKSKRKVIKKQKKSIHRKRKKRKSKNRRRKY